MVSKADYKAARLARRSRMHDDGGGSDEDASAALGKGSEKAEYFS